MRHTPSSAFKNHVPKDPLPSLPSASSPPVQPSNLIEGQHLRRNLKASGGLVEWALIVALSIPLAGLLAWLKDVDFWGARLLANAILGAVLAAGSITGYAQWAYDGDPRPDSAIMREAACLILCAALAGAFFFGFAPVLFTDEAAYPEAVVCGTRSTWTIAFVSGSVLASFHRKVRCRPWMRIGVLTFGTAIGVLVWTAGSLRTGLVFLALIVFVIVSSYGAYRSRGST